MLSLQTRPVAHKWIPVVGGLMILIGIIIALSAFNGETPMMYAYQIVILGAMLFGLGFLACTMWALLSKIGESNSVPKPSSNIDRLVPSEQISGVQEAEDKKSKEIKRNQANPALSRRNMFCENCGAQLGLTQKFCGKCGSSRN